MIMKKVSWQNKENALIKLTQYYSSFHLSFLDLFNRPFFFLPMKSFFKLLNQIILPFLCQFQDLTQKFHFQAIFVLLILLLMSNFLAVIKLKIRGPSYEVSSQIFVTRDWQGSFQAIDGPVEEEISAKGFLGFV